jgi:hypothetical protein
MGSMARVLRGTKIRCRHAIVMQEASLGDLLVYLLYHLAEQFSPRVVGYRKALIFRLSVKENGILSHEKDIGCQENFLVEFKKLKYHVV